MDTEPQEVEEQPIDATLEVAEQEYEETQGEHVEPEGEIDPDEPMDEEPKSVPLTALQKERRRRQEAEEKAYRAELERKILAEQYAKNEEPEEDYSLEEPITKGEYQKGSKQSQEEIMRSVDERIWVRQNSDKAAFVDEHLEDFLRKKPNLASAISQSTNRYEEAYFLMSRLNPSHKKQERPRQERKPSPNSPSAVPKAAAMNSAVDVMSMDDEEFSRWRSEQKARSKRS